MKIKPIAKQDVSQQYTPPNWALQKALYLITFPAAQSSQSVGPADITPVPAPTTRDDSTDIVYPDMKPTYQMNASGPGFNVALQMSMFVFDAIKRAAHGSNANATQHPLQTGFNMTDHVIMQPNRLTLEVGMSDAIASYSVPGYSPMWDMTPSKSVSAWQVMKMLMEQRQLMTINTRLQTYNNMVLIGVESEDSARTYFGGLAMTLTFQQVIVSAVASQAMSARLQSTGETKQGTVRTDQPAQATVDQHKIPDSVTTPPAQGSKIPGAGIFQSPIIQRIFSGALIFGGGG